MDASRGSRPAGSSLMPPSGLALSLAFLAVIVAPTAAALAFADGWVATLVGVGTGVAALAMLLAQFVTSGRFEGVSGRIGLDRIMGFHRVAGTATILFIAVHIVALAAARNPANLAQVANRTFHMLTSGRNLAGLLALLLAVALVVLARRFRGKGLPYVGWRVSHGIGALLVIGLSAVHVRQTGEAVLEPLPATILSALGIAAVASLAVIYVLRPLRAYRHGFTVDAVRRRSPGVVELVVKTNKPGSFAFKAGQFAWIATGGRHTVTDNPFSIASAPGELPAMRFLVREAGDATRRIIDLAPGTKVAVDGPHGSFVAREANALLMAAGGIGIAPILSMLLDAAGRADTRPYRLAYAAKTAADLVALDEIERLSAKLDLKIRLFVEQGEPVDGAARGRVTAEALRDMVGECDPSGTVAYVCGPPGMMDGAIAALVSCGLPAERIVAERFDYDAAGDPVSRGVRWRFHALIATVLAATVLLSFAAA